MRINWVFPDLEQRYAMMLNNSALTYRADAAHPTPTATITLRKPVLNAVFAGQIKPVDAVRSGQIQLAGDQQALASLFGMLDSFSPSFNIVTPAAR
jgi:alkyl sulfatase BDS1-like metallo-beta-lactamase superfamily hydrolase